MGKLINGTWSLEDTPSALVNKKGEFVRAASGFRDWVAPDGTTGYPAEAGRYHLFLSHSCPWAHRTQIGVMVKGLQDVVGMCFAILPRNDQGWEYGEGTEGMVTGNRPFPLHRLYSDTDPGFTGRVTTPTLWDNKTGKVVNNESSDILRMLNSAFRAYKKEGAPDLYPESLREEIDAINERVYPDFNNGVYRCGFARSQEAYEEAFHDVFATLDALEPRLDRHRYLAGHRLTEADIRIFPTLVRFDAVYYSHFKCNLRRIADFPNLSNYLRDLYQTPGFGETVDLESYKRGYYGNSPRLNPSGIIPAGPENLLGTPHDRAERTYSERASPTAA